MPTLRCVFCGGPLPAATCVWVRRPDGGDVVCCPGVCSPMRDAIEARRRDAVADRAQLPLPLGAG
jgi:hypothetical protein